MAQIDKVQVGTVTYTLACAYAECSIAAATAAKAVSVTGADLTTGTQLNIKFINGNTATSPTLSINGGTAKNIVSNSGVCALNKYTAGSIMHLLYDGTSWNIIG